MFDATDLSWRLSEKKIAKAKNSIVSALSKGKSGLRDWQRLVGRLNDISQLYPFLRIFKSSINEVMSGVPTDAPKDLQLEVPDSARRDLLVWAGFLWSEFRWMPIPREIHAPPLLCKEFVSDAAGLALEADFSTGPGAEMSAFQRTAPSFLRIRCSGLRASSQRPQMTVVLDLETKLPLWRCLDNCYQCW
jgi:hypothetical protein